GDAVADARAVDGGREIRLDAPASLMLTGDDARLREVVANLLSNALAHTDADVDVTLREADGTAVLEVADHGPGLTEEQRVHAFEPFYRADAGRSRGRGGAGLGLSIVSAIVEAHGGTVTISETSGGGATFRVTLPADLRSEDGEPAAEAATIVADPATERRGSP